MGKKRTILAGVLSAMLILAGCGKQDAITDYGNGVDDHLTEETKGGVDSTAANTESEGDITETAATKSDLSKNELFGDKQIQWRDKFSVDDGKVNVDGGTYKTSGVGSPAIYSTADISVSDRIFPGVIPEQTLPDSRKGLFFVSVYSAAFAVIATQAGLKPLRIAFFTDRTFDQAAA